LKIIDIKIIKINIGCIYEKEVKAEFLRKTGGEG